MQKVNHKTSFFRHVFNSALVSMFLTAMTFLLYVTYIDFSTDLPQNQPFEKHLIESKEFPIRAALFDLFTEEELEPFSIFDDCEDRTFCPEEFLDIQIDNPDSKWYKGVNDGVIVITDQSDRIGYYAKYGLPDDFKSIINIINSMKETGLTISEEKNDSLHLFAIRSDFTPETKWHSLREVYESTRKVAERYLNSPFLEQTGHLYISDSMFRLVVRDYSILTSSSLIKYKNGKTEFLNNIINDINSSLNSLPTVVLNSSLSVKFLISIGAIQPPSIDK